MANHWHSNNTTEISNIMSNRIQNMVKMRTLSKDLDTSSSVGVAQTSARNGNEIHDGIELVQHFGIATVPPVGSYAATIATSGLNDNAFIIGTHNPKYHPVAMKPGEVQIYDVNGQQIYVRTDGTIIINAKTTVDVQIGGSSVMKVTAGKVAITGDLSVSGSVTAQGDVTGAGISLDGHVHSGVQAGGSTTGKPQ